jgi:2-polyprenyl-3-methyl-5-hydroxy-6-metoxy-1,4-benzoquinol methylase
MNIPLCTVCGGVSQPDAKHPDANLYRCRACSHCFSEPTGSEETYDARYFREAHQNWFEHPDYVMFRRVERAIVGARSVLDVGCGNCDLLAYLRGRLPEARLVGVDLALPPPIPGVEFIQGDIMFADAGTGFDAVVTLQAIEHIGDVQPFVARLVNLCRPGGLVIVSTVNERSTIYRVARLLKKFGLPMAFDRLYSRHHLNHFNMRSLRRLIESAGLTVLSHAAHSYPLAKADVPKAGPIMTAAYRAAVAILFSVGPGVLQTLVCRRPASAQESAVRR